jgi:hypothetical protein
MVDAFAALGILLHPFSPTPSPKPGQVQIAELADQRHREQFRHAAQCLQRRDQRRGRLGQLLTYFLERLVQFLEALCAVLEFKQVMRWHFTMRGSLELLHPGPHQIFRAHQSCALGLVPALAD